MSEQKNSSMNNESHINSIILVVEDVNETRDGIEKLLMADGYRVTLARDDRVDIALIIHRTVFPFAHAKKR